MSYDDFLKLDPDSQRTYFEDSELCRDFVFNHVGYILGIAFRALSKALSNLEEE